MALTKSDIPELILPGLRAEFSLAFRNETSGDSVAQIATIINTTQPIQRYPVLESAPAMREFTDERVLKGLSSRSFAIEDKVFESTLAVSRTAMEDDQLDLIRLRVRDLANRVASHRHEKIAQLLLNGANEVGYDGVGLLSESHPSGSNTASNVFSEALESAALKDATKQMMSFTDSSNIPLGISPDTLLVGPENMWKALELVESPGATNTNGGPGVINVFRGRLKVVVSPFITDSSWFLLDTKRPIRSVILQQRSDVPVEFTALDNSSRSESAFLRDQYLYGVRARYNVGPGMWQTVFGSREDE